MPAFIADIVSESWDPFLYGGN